MHATRLAPAARARVALTVLVLTCLNTAGMVRERWRRAHSDRGSETVEKAVIAALLLAAALGLAAAITSVISNYQGQLQSP